MSKDFTFYDWDFFIFFYLVVGGIVSWTLPLPEIIKSILSFPSLIIFYYLMGKTSLFVIFSIKKNNIFPYIEQLKFFSKYLFFWLFGFLIFSSVLTLLIFLDWIIFTNFQNLFISEIIIRFLIFYLMLFISILLYMNFKKVNFDFSLSRFLDYGWIMIITFILTSFSIVMISRLSLPFPFFGHGFASPSINALLVERLVNEGYINTWRFFELGSMYIGTTLFNIGSLSYIWISSFFSFFLSMVGIFFYSYILTGKKKILSLFSSIIGSIFMINTAEWGNGLINTFKGNFFLPILLIFVLIFLHENISILKQIKIKKNILLLCLPIFIFLYGAYIVFIGGKESLFQTISNHFIFTLLLLFAIIVIIYRFNISGESKLIYSFFIILLISLFFHDTEFIIFYFIVIFYSITLKLNFSINKKTRSMLFYVFTILLFSIFLIQFFGVDTFQDFTSKFKIDEVLPSTVYSSTLDYEWKINALSNWTASNWVWIIFSLGIIFSVFYSKNSPYLLVIISFMVGIYFFPIGITYRIEKFMGPFIGYFITSFFVFLKYSFKFKKKFLFLLITIIVSGLMIGSIQNLSEQFSLKNDLPTDSGLSFQEYEASLWMKNNLNENIFLLTDWFSYFVITPISNKITPIELDMNPNLAASSKEDKDKWNLIRDIFNANNSEEAYNKIDELSKLPITDEREKFYIERKKAKDKDFENINFIILLSNRGTKWFGSSNLPDDRYIIPPMIQYYSTEDMSRESPYINQFNDTKYFTLWKNIDNKVYIFSVNNMTRPLK